MNFFKRLFAKLFGTGDNTPVEPNSAQDIAQSFYDDVTDTPNIEHDYRFNREVRRHPDRYESPQALHDWRKAPRQIKSSRNHRTTAKRNVHKIRSNPK